MFNIPLLSQAGPCLLFVLLGFFGGCKWRQGAVDDLHQQLTGLQAENTVARMRVAQSDAAISQLREQADQRQKAAQEAVAQANEAAQGEYEKAERLMAEPKVIVKPGPVRIVKVPATVAESCRAAEAVINKELGL